VILSGWEGNRGPGGK